MSEVKEKKCFIITPIGDANSNIRNEIEGVIEAAIKPLLEKEYSYIVEVAHEITESGEITEQLINKIYEADLLIVNLTNLNPNVMYELAFAHALRKPVIIIAKDGTILPFDIQQERTIFYEDTMAGVSKLNQGLKDRIESIHNSDGQINNTIYNNLKNIQTDNLVKENIDKIEDIDPDIKSLLTDMYTKVSKLDKDISYIKNNNLKHDLISLNKNNGTNPIFFNEIINRINQGELPTIKVPYINTKFTKIDNFIITEYQLNLILSNEESIVLHKGMPIDYFTNSKDSNNYDIYRFKYKGYYIELRFSI